MAGAAVGRPEDYMTRQGFIYDADAGGYVNGKSINPKTGRAYSDGNTTNPTLDSRGLRVPRRPHELRTPEQHLEPTYGSGYGGAGGGSGYGYGGGGGGGSAPGSGSQPASNPWQNEIQSLISELRSSQPSTPTTAPIVGGTGGSPYDMAAETAAYGRAKERTGLATQSALKSMREQMAVRGISGSGIEAEMMGDVYNAGLGDLAETDRQLAEKRAGRAFTAEQSNIDRLIQQQQFNANTINAGTAGSAQERLARLGLMAQLMKLY